MIIKAKHSDLTLVIFEVQGVFKYLLVNLNLHFLVNEVSSPCLLLSNISNLISNLLSPPISLHNACPQHGYYNAAV